MPDQHGAGTQAANEPRTGSPALQQLKRGEITLDQYLDTRADAAVQHVARLVSTERLAFLRQLVRDQLATDPVVVELVRRTTTAAGVGGRL